MGNGFRIGVNTFRESLREPVYVLTLFSVLAVIAVYPAAADFVFYEEQKFVADGAMATMWFGALFISALSAGKTISRELRNGSVLLTLSKPVSSFSYIAGKFSGVAAAALLFGTAASCATLTSLSIATDAFRFDALLVLGSFGILFLAAFLGTAANFLKGVSFPEYASLAAWALSVAWCVFVLTKVPELPFQLPETVKALVALLGAIALLAVTASAVAFFFDLVPTLGIMLGIFFAGALSRYLFVRETTNAALAGVLRVAYAVVPDWQIFWLSDALATKRPIPWSYTVSAWGYALLLTALIALWTHYFFSRREAARGRN